MKFSEMPYARPDLDAVKQQFADLLARFKAAATYAEAHAVFLEEEKLNKHVDTLAQLASVRNTIDTRDKFYDEEMNFWNEATPQLQECQNAWSRAMLDSPFRADFTAEYGDLMFVNAEIADKAFSPDILDEMAQENKLTTEYGKLIASAQIPFEGGVYTLSQLSPFKNDPDDARRLAAWKAEGAWYKEHGAEFDGLYDQLVHLRDTMGKKLGYEGYTTLGYYRMGRNCYTKADVEKFRAAVVKYIVPLADSIYREQAGQSGLQRRRGLLRGVGPGHCFRDGRQHGVPHLQFQQLVVPGIAVGQDMQPDRISPHPGGGALVPVGQRGKYKRQRQPQANAQLQHTAGMARHNTFPLSTGVWDERGNSKHYFFAPNRRRTVTRGPPWVGLQR
mgnify:CR=1 FL=1